MNAVCAAAAIASLLAACSSAPVSGTVATGADADRSREALYATAWMQKSAEYRANTIQTFRNAVLRLPEAIKAGSADISQRSRPAKEWETLPAAVVFDLDETLLNNSAYEAWLIQNRRGFDRKTWDAWIDASEATAIPGAAEFAKRLVDCSNAKPCVAKVFYVTNRECGRLITPDMNRETRDERCPQLAHTKEVMERYGFPGASDDSSYYLKGMYKELDSKRQRREKIGREYRIVMLVGDNLRDFVDRRADYFASEKELKKMWGVRWIVLPNPMYGSWTGALVPRDVVAKIRAVCGERPAGADNGSRVKAWNDCAYPLRYRAIENSLESWSGP